MGCATQVLEAETDRQSRLMATWSSAQKFFVAGELWWDEEKTCCLLVLKDSSPHRNVAGGLALRSDGRVITIRSGNMESTGRMLYLTGCRWYIPEGFTASE